jgi:DNA-binding NtrC family response regulator
MKPAIAHSDRKFFRLLAEAAGTNPFSDDYMKLLLEIADCDKSASSEERLQRIINRAGEKARNYESSFRANSNGYSADDRELLKRAFLFDAYHRFLPSLDKLILDQEAAGEMPAKAPFYAEVIACLTKRGFSQEEAFLDFAFFYQICRAFFFIERGLVGRCESMKQLRRHLWNNVFTNDIRLYERYLWRRMEDFSTMLLGPTGAGKGTAAAAIGQSGFIPFDERKGAFVESYISGYKALNLSQFSESLIESELFGHRKGAFTGAIEAHEGAFFRCSAYGAIFLDEIGDVSQPIQIKLLNVLQERVYSPVGSHEKLRFKGRIIAATNKPLHELRAREQFRNDLFYRLCSDIIHVPSLQERIAEDPAEMDDLGALIVNRIVGEAATEVLDMVRRELERSPGKHYSWPGNVRELEQAVRRILLTRSYQKDTAAVSPGLDVQLQEGLAEGRLTADALLSGYCALLYERYGSYEEVARRTNLDRRTVKSNVLKYQNIPLQSA